MSFLRFEERFYLMRAAHRLPLHVFERGWLLDWGKYDGETLMANIPKVREEIPAYLNELGLVGAGVEVGVQEGQFSKVLLNGWKGGKLYLVDIWRPLPSSEDPANVSLQQQRSNFMATFDAVAPYDPRPVIIRDSSVSAASLFADKSLDFIYIDAGHLYKDVKEDLFAWASKVKNGGLLMGHDYTQGDMKVVDGEGRLLSTFRIEVKQAVDEWAALLEKTVVTTQEANFKSWIIQM